MEKQNLKYRLLADLLATLKAEEFAIGIGKHLDLQELLSKIPDDIEPEEMKTLLCPIFAKNKQDQSYFYELFNQSLARAKAKTWKPKASEEIVVPPVDKLARWIKVLAGLLFFSILAAIFFIVENDDPIKMPAAYSADPIEVQRDSTHTIFLSDYYRAKDSSGVILTDTSTILYASFLDGQDLVVDSTFGTFQIDSLGKFTVSTLDSTQIFRKEIGVVAKYHPGLDTTYFTLFLTTNNQDEEEDEEDIVEQYEPDTLNYKSHPYPKSLANLFPTEPPEWMVFYQKYHIPIKVFLSLLLLALFGLWARWWKERNQQIVADIQSKTDPPLLWNIEIPNVGKLGLNENYFQVLNQMRQRTSDDHFVLNIPKTIDRTIEQAGVVDFQYQYKTRPPEYLLLIDRQSSKNHRAHLYDYLFQNFKANEVYIERFFYEGDIRLCWNEYYPNGIKLTDLQQSFRESRLIIIGSGYQMLNPTNGKLAKWTKYFDGWADKAILSPRPTNQWGGREKQLQQKFILLPASMQSLTAMVDKMEAIDPDEIKTKITDDINEPIEFRGDLIETLHHYFSVKKDGEIVDDRLVQWIAACAIYPTVHWDLTMFLGQELSDEDHQLLTVDNVIQLTRLPWFIDGKIPEQARLELLEYLPSESELHLRKSLQQLFDNSSMPNETSVAYSDARMNIALNEYLLEKNPRLKKEYEQYLRAGTEADVTMLKYLEGEKSPKDFEVDQSWRKFAQGEQADLENDKLTKYLGVGVLLLILGIMFFNPTHEGCKGDLVQFGDNEYCIETPREQLVLREFQIRELIKNNNYEPIDSLENLSITEFYLNEIFEGDKDTLSIENLISNRSIRDRNIVPLMESDTSIIHFYKNISVDFYNHGVPLYNLNQDSALIQNLDSLAIFRQDQFCELFYLAIFYEGQISAGEVTKDLDPIIQKICDGDTIVQQSLNLISKVGGKVFDQSTQKRIKDVEVTLFNKKDKTNSRGRYLFDVPADVEETDFEITFKKEGYKDFSKTIARSQLEIVDGVNTGNLDLENVFLEPADNQTTGDDCFETFFRRAEQSLKEEKWDRAYDNIKSAKKCDDITENQNNRLKKLESNLPIVPVDDNETLTRFVDSRDAQSYTSIKIGEQTWMAENLNYKIPDSHCYEDDPKNCEKNGRLYLTKKLKGICPSGWRLPSNEDFLYLFSKNGLKEFIVYREDLGTKSESEKVYDNLVEGGPSNFNWPHSGVGEFRSGSKIEYSLLDEVGVLASSSFFMDARLFYVIGKDEKRRAVLIESRSDDRNDMVSCRCVKGLKPNPEIYSLKENGVIQSTTSQPTYPILEIEVVNKLTGEGLPGIEISSVPVLNFVVDRSGYRYTATVKNKSDYQIIANGNGFNEQRQTLYIGRSGKSLKIEMSPVQATTGSLLLHPKLLPYAKDILAYYPLNGNAKDALNSNDATAIIDAISGTDKKGRAGRSLYFDGKEARVELPKIIDTEDRFLSISFWIKRISDGGAIFGQYTEPRGKGYIGYKNHINLDYGEVRIDDYPPLGGNKDIKAKIPKEVWTHVVIVRRPSLEIIYIDGKFVRQGAEKEFFSKEWGDLYNIVLGARPQRNGYDPRKSFKGWLDELIIFDNAIDENVVEILYDINK